MKRKTWPWWIAAGVFVLDRITKILSVRIPAGGEVLVPGILGLRYAESRGIAFSMLSGQPALAGLLSLAVITVSNIGVTLLHNAGMDRTVAKIICDTLLYFANYQVQERWIFRDRRPAENG